MKKSVPGEKAHNEAIDCSLSAKPPYIKGRKLKASHTQVTYYITEEVNIKAA